MKAIFSASPTTGIGCNGQLLYHDPDDMRFFQEMTMYGVIIMGRKTFDSIAHPLRFRINVVITRDPEKASREYFNSSKFANDAEVLFVTEAGAKEYIIANSMGLLHTKNNKIFVIGGAEIFNMFKKNISEVYVNRFHEESELKPDTYLDLKGFEKYDCMKNTDDTSYYTIERKMYELEKGLLGSSGSRKELPFTTEVWENPDMRKTIDWFNENATYMLSDIVGDAGTREINRYIEYLRRFMNDIPLLKTNMWHLKKFDPDRPFDLSDIYNKGLTVNDMNGLFDVFSECYGLMDRVSTILKRTLKCSELYMIDQFKFRRLTHYEEVLSETGMAFEFIEMIKDKILREFVGDFKFEQSAFTQLAENLSMNAQGRIPLE